MTRSRATMSSRAMLRAIQQIHRSALGTRFDEDIKFLQSKDLDLSIRLGAILAFNALLITVAINPIAASPGAPLSLDAPSQPIEVAAIVLSISLLAWSCFDCLRAMLIGEEIEGDPSQDSPEVLTTRIEAAYCLSIDVQSRMLRAATRWTIAGGSATAVSCLWIMVQKMLAA